MSDALRQLKTFFIIKFVEKVDSVLLVGIVFRPAHKNMLCSKVQNKDLIMVNFIAIQNNNGFIVPHYNY